MSLGRLPDGRRLRRSRTFDSRTQAEAWIATPKLEHRQLANPVTDDRLADYLPWWVFTTRTGHPIDQRNVSRAFHRARTAAGVDHGSLKTFRSTVATQLVEAGLHPSKTQAFLGDAHATTTLTYYTAITDVDEPQTSYPTCTDRPHGRTATLPPERPATRRAS